MIIQEETICDEIGFAQLKVRIFPLVDPTRVETKAEVCLGLDRSTESGVQTGENWERFDVFKFQLQLGQIIDKECHILAGQQSKCLHRIREKRESETPTCCAYFLGNLVCLLILSFIWSLSLTTRDWCRILRCSRLTGISSHFEGPERDQNRSVRITLKKLVDHLHEF